MKRLDGVPEDYLRLLESLADVVGANEDGILDCYSPETDLIDEGGHLGGRPCWECAACNLNAAVSALHDWQNEHDYWPVRSA